MAIDLGRGADLMTRRQVDALIVQKLAEQRKGLEEFMAHMFGKYHEGYHGTPPLAPKTEATA